MAKPETPPRVQGRRARWAAWSALCVGTALITIFGLRTWGQWQFAQRLASGEVQVETVRGWMTLPYIASLHRVPEADLRAAIGAPATGRDELSLRQWFKATGTDAAAGRRAIEAVILARALPASGPAP